MKLLRSLESNPAFSVGTAVTIGNFDGVHLGHQALLNQLKAKAQELELPTIVLLFEPQPSEFFLADKAGARLSSLREKLEILAQFQIDYVYCLRFNRVLANMSAADFASSCFFSFLQSKYLLIGEDFRFGAKRLGDIQLLTLMGKQQNCLVETFPDFIIDNERASSTKIRQALSKGQLDIATTLLGRSYSLCGRVVVGNQRGRQWGVPTANLTMRRLTPPLTGVFCVKVRLESGEIVNGVANLGRRPTIDGSKNILEIHLFDFNKTIYGEMLQVYFLQKIRDEIRFPCINELIEQIYKDITDAKARFSAGRFEFNKNPCKSFDVNPH